MAYLDKDGLDLLIRKIKLELKANSDNIQSIIQNAPDELDTLKEIADYLKDSSVAGGIVSQLSNKANKSTTVTNVSYDSTNKKITKTINNTTSDVVTAATLKTAMSLNNVANTGDSATPVSGGTTKFTTGGAYTELAKKVDKVSGKDLSSNDFTTTDKSAIRYYGTCSTSRATNAKVVTCTNFVLETGCRIIVKFTDTAGAASTSGNITLNVNNTGAKNVFNKNATQMTYSHSGEFRANRYCEFVYDGNNFIYLNYDSNTTYTTITQAEITSGTSTGVRTVTPKLLADNFQKKESGKGLSTNDFTAALKTKLENITAITDAEIETLWTNASNAQSGGS